MTSIGAARDQPPEGIGLAAFNALPAEQLRAINDLRLTKLIGP